MRMSSVLHACETRLILFAWTLTMGLLLPWGAQAQERVERDGVVLYWGLVPAALVSQQHALQEMHGGPPPGGGKLNHLVVALFDSASGRRLDDAIVRAQLIETSIADAPAKYLTPMAINGLASYGQVFGMVHEGPYRFRIVVELPARSKKIEYDITAASQLGGKR